MMTPEKNQCDEWRIEYTLLLAKEKKASDYFENKNISEKEKENWFPEYSKITSRIAELLGLIKNYNQENITYGWPELLNKGGGKID